MRLADLHRPIANLVVSNVPGPDFPLYLGGAELKAGFPLGPVMDGMGLNITIMSYRGVLYWGIIACPETIPLAWDLTAAIPPALDELLADAGEAPATYRSEAAVTACRAPGMHRPGPVNRTTPVGGPGPDHGAGAMAMDDAPEHTRIGRPKECDPGA
jgi:hypothetical protein